MDELLQQITLPDGIAAGATSALIGVIVWLIRRLMRMERLERDKALLSRNQNLQLQAIFDLLVILLRDNKTSEQREDSMIEVVSKLNDKLKEHL